MVQAEQADAALVVGVFDGLPQRCILLVRGVRARRGGVAREASGGESTNQPTNGGLSAASSAADDCITCNRKRISLLLAHFSLKKKMGLVGWASNYASPGLLFWVAEGPAPRRLR